MTAYFVFFFFFPVKVNMKHRSVTHSFMLLPIPNPSAEQAQPPVFSVSGTKRAALPALLLSSESSLSHANARTHQSGRRRLNLSSSFPWENGGLPLVRRLLSPRSLSKRLVERMLLRCVAGNFNTQSTSSRLSPRHSIADGKLILKPRDYILGYP